MIKSNKPEGPYYKFDHARPCLIQARSIVLESGGGGPD